MSAELRADEERLALQEQVMPRIGSVDSARAQQVIEALLSGVRAGDDRYALH